MRQHSKVPSASAGVARLPDVVEEAALGMGSGDAVVDLPHEQFAVLAGCLRRGGGRRALAPTAARTVFIVAICARGTQVSEFCAVDLSSFLRRSSERFAFFAARPLPP